MAIKFYPPHTLYFHLPNIHATCALSFMCILSDMFMSLQDFVSLVTFLSAILSLCINCDVMEGQFVREIQFVYSGSSSLFLNSNCFRPWYQVAFLHFHRFLFLAVCFVFSNIHHQSVITVSWWDVTRVCIVCTFYSSGKRIWADYLWS